MAKYLVETYYTCNIKVSHYLDDITEDSLKNLEKREDGKFEIIDIKLDSRKTKNLEKKDNKKINIVEEENAIPVSTNSKNNKDLPKSKNYLLS